MFFFRCCKSKPKEYLLNANANRENRYSVESCSRSNEFGHITELYLVDKSMTEITEQLIYSSRNIGKMWLSHNSLSYLPIEMVEMSALCSIWLSNNMFDHIPCLPTTIRNIYIDNNNVKV